jgi:chromosome segregation ATPase
MIETTSRPARAVSMAFAAIVTLLAVTDASGQEQKVKAVIGEQTKTEVAAQASQNRVAQMDDEAASMLADYRQAIAEAQSLKAYNEQLSQQVKSQNEEIGSMSSQLTDIENTSREVLPMMNKMLDALEQFVKLDVPFLPEERRNRLQQLRDMMGRADVTISEKYRRIVEAYQIETEYGRTIEAYEGTIDDKTMQFLRAGRVALVYQSLDGKETGYWDQRKKTWVRDDSYSDSTILGLKIAKKQSAPDFFTVPVPAPKEVQ